MTARRTRSLIVSTLLGAVALTACGGSDDASSDGDFCGVLEEASSISDRGDAAGSDEEILDALRDLADKMDEAAAAAPAEIEDDVETFAAATRLLTGVTVGQDELTDEQAAAVEDPDTIAAANRVSDYASEECGIEIN